MRTRLRGGRHAITDPHLDQAHLPSAAQLGGMVQRNPNPPPMKAPLDRNRLCDLLPLQKPTSGWRGKAKRQQEAEKEIAPVVGGVIQWGCTFIEPNGQ